MSRPSGLGPGSELSPHCSCWSATRECFRLRLRAQLAQWSPCYLGPVAWGLCCRAPFLCPELGFPALGRAGAWRTLLSLKGPLWNKGHRSCWVETVVAVPPPQKCQASSFWGVTGGTAVLVIAGSCCGVFSFTDKKCPDYTCPSEYWGVGGALTGGAG